jgi:hypothetical protein
MPFDPHERARFLIDESRVAGISAEESQWLSGHLGECAECARQDAITSRMLGAMDELAFGGTDHRLSWSVQRPKAAAWRWPLAAAAVILLAAIPFYKSARDARQAEADAILLERVGDQVSRIVPQALEPLIQPESGDPQ